MSDEEHVPDGKTQRALFHLRSRARTANIQRRSQVNQTLDQGYGNSKAVQEDTDKALHEQSVKRLNNAEATIVALLQNNAAFQQTIEQLTEAWGEDQPKALAHADALLEQASEKIRHDSTYTAAAKSWAKDRMSSNHQAPVERPKLKRRPRAR